MRPTYEHANQARQILNDAEDDLKDWQPELEDVTSASQNGLMGGEVQSGGPVGGRQAQSTIAGSEIGEGSVVHRDSSLNDTLPGEQTGESGGQNRNSIGSSVSPGLVTGGYPRSEAESSQVA